MMFYVYEHIRPDTNTIFYVGKGKQDRGYTRNGRNPHWHHVVNKADGFSVRMVAENVDEELAFLLEVERIDQLRRLGVKLCNMTDGGEGMSGYVPSDETRRKLSEALKGHGVSEETRQKLSEASKGYVPTEAARRKMSEAGKGRVVSEETRRKISNTWTGRKRGPMSEEQKLRLSEAHKGRVVSEETKRKIGVAHKGKTLSEATRQKLSDANKGHVPSEATRQKLSEAAKKQVHSDERRKKMSALLKGRVFTEDHRRKLSEANKGRLPATAIAVRFDGRVFESVTALSKYLGRSLITIATRVRTNPQKYGYVIETSKC